MKFFKRLRRLSRIAGLGLLLAAISQEMSKPEASRTWHGRLWGIVPYDFRPPTWDRLREAYWNPRDDRILTDRPLGVGWALNFYQLRDIMIQSFESVTGSEMPYQVKNFGTTDASTTTETKTAASGRG